MIDFKPGRKGGISTMSFMTEAHALKLCPYCLDELRRGIPEDGKCGHEHLLAEAERLCTPTVPSRKGE